jgi:hypothetical protein
MDKHDTAGVNLPLPTPGQRPALCVMVLGTSSGAGKSWVATALCAWYHARGFKVAPFKAQNMSNNARVVAAPGGAWGEIGTAQYLQALAAGCAPDVRMNPLLLKPEADMRSQLVVGVGNVVSHHGLLARYFTYACHEDTPVVHGCGPVRPATSPRQLERVAVTRLLHIQQSRAL